MAPHPKRKHSTQRKGKRLASRVITMLPALIVCSSCSRPKLPHRICRNCGK